MNKKVLGASLRRGVLTGTVAGFVAGWSAFVGHGKQLDAVQLDAWQEVQDKKADLVLPSIPGVPQLPAVPGAQTYRLRYGPDGPAPRVVAPDGRSPSPALAPAASSAATAPSLPAVIPSAVTAPPAPMPTFAPLPALPPAPIAPAPTTRSSPPRK